MVSQLKKFLEDYSQKLPPHELEILLESAFHQAFPEQPRLERQQIYSVEELPDGEWITQARIWAEKRLLAKVPLQHLTREQCFFGRYFEVGPEVLIPRPETEVLVETVLSRIKRTSDYPMQVGAEVGTGSGIIPITLLKESSKLKQMVATELSEDARFRAKKNASQNAVPKEALTWLSVSDSSHVLQPLLTWQKSSRVAFDFLVSNPPYLRDDPNEVEEEVSRWEPPHALFAPEGDPLFFYREMAQGAHLLLRSGAWVFLEIPHERADNIVRLFLSHSFSEVRILPDLTGKSRILEARLDSWTK
jgi:release factor glutamine methyltransferase